MKNTILVVASNSPTSINLDVAKKINNKYPELKIYESKDVNVEIFNPALLANGFPKSMTNFIDTITSYENIVFITPEHNGYLPSFFKNIMDWASVGHKGMKWLENKNVVIVSASPGSTGGSTVREFFGKVLPFTGAQIKGTIGIPNYNLETKIDDKIDELVKLLG